MSKHTGYSVRIDKNEQTIAAVARTGPQAWEVAELANAREGTPPPQSLAHDMARQHEAVTWLLPNDLATAAVIPLPPLKGKELARAVTGWVAREEKGLPGDYAVSWSTLPRTKDKSEDPRQTVFALHAELKEIQEQMSLPLARQVTPARMLPSFMVLDRFFRLVQPAPTDDRAWTLVFLGRHENFLLIARNDCLLMTRALPFDLSDGDEREQYVEQLATEVDRSAFFVRQGSHNSGLARIVVAGDPLLTGSLAAALGDRTDIPAEVWNIADHFTWGERAVSAEALVPLMAAALSLETVPYNLLPEAKRSLLSPRTRRRLLVAAGTAGVALLPVIVVGSAVTAKVQEGYLNRARQRLDTARVEAQEAADIYKQQRLLLSQQNHIRDFRQERPDLEAILLRIGAMAPREVMFRDLRISEDDLGKTRLMLTGESEAATSSQAQAAFLAFQKALESAPFLQVYTEPIKLEISGESTDNEARPRTIFQMKFLLVSEPTREG